MNPKHLHLPDHISADLLPYLPWFCDPPTTNWNVRIVKWWHSERLYKYYNFISFIFQIDSTYLYILYLFWDILSLHYKS